MSPVGNLLSNLRKNYADNNCIEHGVEDILKCPIYLPAVIDRGDKKPDEEAKGGWEGKSLQHTNEASYSANKPVGLVNGVNAPHKIQHRQVALPVGAK